MERQQSTKAATRVAALAILMIAPAVAGCSAPAAQTSVGTAAAGGAPADAAPAALLVNGRPVAWERVRTQLAEAAGAAIVRDEALRVLIEGELTRRGMSVSSAEVAAEEQILAEALSGDAQESARLIEALRRREGLGPERWSALLWRSAALRALVRSEVTVTEAAMDAAFDVAYGPKRQGRILVAAERTELEALLARLADGESFADVATRSSTDSSATRGGLLEPMARRDAAYPPSLREALWSTPIGRPSGILMLDSGYGVVQPERELPAQPVDRAAVGPALERAVRRSQERLAMERLSQRLLSEARITVMDATLNCAWERGSE